MNDKSWRALVPVCGVLILLCGCYTLPPPLPDEPEPVIQPALKEKRTSAELPRVMLLIDERNLGTIPTSEVEALAVKHFLRHNFLIVDQEMVRSNLQKDKQMLKMANDNRGAATLGLQFGADVIIVGDAVAKPSARRIKDTNLRTYQAVVTLRAVRTDNSITLASASETASVLGLEDVAGGSKALKQAGHNSLKRLIPDTINVWCKASPSTTRSALNHVVVTVGGVDQMWKLKAIRECLQNNKNLKHVVQRNYTAGSALFEIDSSIPTEELAEHVVLSPPEGLRLQVLEIGPSKISMRAVKK